MLSGWHKQTRMNVEKSYVFARILLVILLLNVSYAEAQVDTIYESGKKRFRKNCSSCHAVHQEIYGPMLASIPKKKERSWLIPFIKNSQAVIRSGDPYATQLFAKFNKQTMPSFEWLTDSEIDAILHYINIESVQPSEFLNDSEIPETVNSSILEGKLEFLAHCSMCHFIHKESDFAPALGSVSKRHTREWLISFIQHSQKKIKDGDPYAVHLYKSFDQHLMTRMEFLQAEEIHSILDYIEFASTVNAAYKHKQYDQIYARQSMDTKGSSTGSSQTIILLLSLTTFVLMLIVFLLLVNFNVHLKNRI